jgi:hypothetical protein
MNEFEPSETGFCRFREGNGTCAITNQVSTEIAKPHCPNKTKTITSFNITNSFPQLSALYNEVVRISLSGC